MQRAVACRLAALERVADFLLAGQEAAWLRQVLHKWGDWSWSTSSGNGSWEAWNRSFRRNSSQRAAALQADAASGSDTALDSLQHAEPQPAQQEQLAAAWQRQVLREWRELNPPGLSSSSDASDDSDHSHRTQPQVPATYPG